MPLPAPIHDRLHESNAGGRLTRGRARTCEQGRTATWSSCRTRCKAGQGGRQLEERSLGAQSADCASMPPGTKLHRHPAPAAALPMLPARSNHPPCLRADGAGAARLADLAPGGGQATGTRGALHGACRQQNEQGSDGLSGPARCTEPAAAEWCPLPSHPSVACEQYGRAGALKPRRPTRCRASTAAADEQAREQSRQEQKRSTVHQAHPGQQTTPDDDGGESSNEQQWRAGASRGQKSKAAVPRMGHEGGRSPRRG